jgi:hypothetical protein
MLFRSFQSDEKLTEDGKQKIILKSHRLAPVQGNTTGEIEKWL